VDEHESVWTCLTRRERELSIEQEGQDMMEERRIPETLRGVKELEYTLK